VSAGKAASAAAAPLARLLGLRRAAPSDVRPRGGRLGARHTAIGLLALAALTLLLHHSALQGSWRADDPMLLAFAAAFSPSQYFFTREGMLQLSYASITPWAPLFYDSNLALFGLAPRGHYAHMLVVLWATAAVTALGLRRWLDAPAAWAAGALFLAMPPTGAIAQQLMTGHYAWGLLFSVLALWAYARALERDSLRWACAAAALYGLATLCKELYVTLPAVLLAWPQACWRMRLRRAAPVLLVAAGYAALRLAVLGGIGGYPTLEDGRSALPAWDSLAFLLQHAQAATLGAGPAGLLALLAVAALTALGWRQGRPLSALLLAGAAVALLLPSLPAFALGGGLAYGNDRIAFVLGWAVAVLMAWQLHGRGWWPVGPRALLGVAALALLLINQREVIARSSGPLDPLNPAYRFLGEAPAGQVLVPPGFAGIGYLDRLAEAMRRVEGRAAPRIVRDEEELAALGPDAGRAAWAWRPDCACLRPLGSDYDVRVREHQQRLQAGAGRPLSVSVQLDARGRGKRLSWQVSGAPASVVIEVRGVNRLPLAPRGAFAFGIDYGTPIADLAHVRFLVTAPDGALQRSDWLALPAHGLQSAHWSTPGSPAPTKP
jgi:hypothetical protein